MPTVEVNGVNYPLLAADEYPDWDWIPPQRPLLVVGQSPAPSAEPGQPAFAGQSGEKLAALAGVEHAYLMAVAETTNLNSTLAGTVGGKYSKFSLGEAKGMAAWLSRYYFFGFKTVLVAGLATAKAFGFEIRPHHFTWESFSPPIGGNVYHRPTEVFVIPHPGGTNKWWNDEFNRVIGRMLVRQAWSLTRPWRSKFAQWEAEEMGVVLSEEGIPLYGGPKLSFDSTFSDWEEELLAAPEPKLKIDEETVLHGLASLAMQIPNFTAYKKSMDLWATMGWAKIPMSSWKKVITTIPFGKVHVQQTLTKLVNDGALLSKSAEHFEQSLKYVPMGKPKVDPWAPPDGTLTEFFKKAKAAEPKPGWEDPESNPLADIAEAMAKVKEQSHESVADELDQLIKVAYKAKKQAKAAGMAKGHQAKNYQAFLNHVAQDKDWAGVKEVMYVKKGLADTTCSCSDCLHVKVTAYTQWWTELEEKQQMIKPSYSQWLHAQEGGQKEHDEAKFAAMKMAQVEAMKVKLKQQKAASEVAKLEAEYQKLVSKSNLAKSGSAEFNSLQKAMSAKWDEIAKAKEAVKIDPPLKPVELKGMEVGEVKLKVGEAWVNVENVTWTPLDAKETIHLTSPDYDDEF